MEIFAIHPASRSVHYVIAPSSWRALGSHCLLFAGTPPVFSSYSHCILNDPIGAQLVWGFTKSEGWACTPASFLCLACDGPASVDGRSNLPFI